MSSMTPPKHFFQFGKFAGPFRPGHGEALLSILAATVYFSFPCHTVPLETATLRQLSFAVLIWRSMRPPKDSRAIVVRKRTLG